MGAASIDTNVKERQLEIMFPMHTREGIETFLEHYNNIHELMFYSGDYDALIMLLDFQVALQESKLTGIECLVLKRVFMDDMKRVDVAKEIGVTKQTVQSWLNRALNKLVKYYAEIEGVFSCTTLENNALKK